MAGTRYIGKLAAILTVNNSDLAPKLSGSAKQVSSFAKTVNSTISQATSSAAKSFNEIFTQTQKLGRALSVANRDPLNLNVDARKVEQLVLAANQLAKPLAAGVKGFGDLATSVQRQFDPALRQVQQSLKSVQAAIDANEAVGASTFRTLAADVGQTTAALSRLQERAAASSRLFRGTELTFVDPRGVDAINAIVAAQQRLANASSATRGSPIARDLIADAQILQEQYQRISARIERLNAEGLDVTVSQTGLDRVIRDLETVARLTNDVAGGAQRGFRLVEAPREQRGLGLFGSAKGSADEQAIARAREVSAEFARLPEAAQAGLRGLAGIASNVANSVEAGTSNASQLNAVLDRLASGITTATEATRAFTLAQTPREQRGLGLFGSAQGSADEQAIARAREVSAEFARLPEAAQAGLRGLAGIASNVANSVEAGTSNASQLNAVLDRLESRINEINDGTGRSTDLGNRLADAGRNRVRGLTGNVNIDSTPPAAGGFSEQAQRDIDALAARVGAVREQLETLPNSIRTRFIPELQRAQAQLIRLQNAPNATVQSIEAATLRVQRLEASARRAAAAFNFRQSFGGAGLRGIEEGLNQQALQGYTAQLQLLQQTLAGTSQAARGPAVAAFNNLRNAIADAMERGTLETQQTRREIQRLTQDAAQATAAAAGIGARGLQRRLQRVGDVGRGAFGNVGLGVQQAIFAIDDFFSVTGGLDQRIRAAGNNLSQLGFIVGGTAGLIGGVLVSALAQGAVALINWSNEGRTSDDVTKALNQTLERQKTLVEQLAQAFSNLGQSLTQGLFSDATQRASEFERQLAEIEKRQRELREERAVAFDPEVVRDRANVRAREREVENAATPEAFVQANIRLREARERERRARERRAEPFTAAQAGESVRQSLDLERQFRTDFDTGAVLGEQEFENRRRRAAAVDQQAQGLSTVAGLRAQRDELIRRRDELAAVQTNDPDITRARAVVEDAINKVDAAISQAIDGAAEEIVRSARQPAIAITQAQNDIAKAIESGVPGARLIGVQLDALGLRLRQALDEIEAASQIEDPIERARRLRPLQDRVRDIRAESDAAQVRADSVRREQTLNPERQIEAVIGRTQEAIDRVGSAAGIQQQRLRELQFQRETVRQQLQAAPADPILIRTEQELNNSIRSLEAEVAALDETMNSFEAREARRLLGDPERGRQLAMTPAERAAEETRQGINDIIARFGDVAAETTGLVDGAGRNAAIDRFIADRARQVAPMTAGFADEVRNAILQGPSRAALGATDASTVEGQRELNRLLRGDDSNRDVDLVRLQEEANALLKQIAEKEAAPVAR